jgi:hypothetical protein
VCNCGKKVLKSRIKTLNANGATSSEQNCVVGSSEKG